MTEWFKAKFSSKEAPPVLVEDATPNLRDKLRLPTRATPSEVSCISAVLRFAQTNPSHFLTIQGVRASTPLAPPPSKSAAGGTTWEDDVISASGLACCVAECTRGYAGFTQVVAAVDGQNAVVVVELPVSRHTAGMIAIVPRTALRRAWFSVCVRDKDVTLHEYVSIDGLFTEAKRLWFGSKDADKQRGFALTVHLVTDSTPAPAPRRAEALQLLQRPSEPQVPYDTAAAVPPAAIARRPPCDDWIEGSVNQYSEGGPAACGAIAMTVVVEALRSGCLTPQVLDGAVRTGVAQHRGADQLETFEVVMSCSAVEVVDHRQFESPDELVDFLAALDDRGVDAVMITKPPETVAVVRCAGGWWFCDSHPRPEEGLRNAFALRFTSLKALASWRRGKSPLITMADIPQLNVCEVFLLRRAVSASVAVATRDVEAAVRSRNDGASVERAILQNLPPPRQDVRGFDAPETPLAGITGAPTVVADPIRCMEHRQNRPAMVATAPGASAPPPELLEGEITTSSAAMGRDRCLGAAQRKRQLCLAHGLLFLDASVTDAIVIGLLDDLRDDRKLTEMFNAIEGDQNRILQNPMDRAVWCPDAVLSVKALRCMVEDMMLCCPGAGIAVRIEVAAAAPTGSECEAGTNNGAGCVRSAVLLCFGHHLAPVLYHDGNVFCHMPLPWWQHAFFGSGTPTSDNASCGRDDTRQPGVRVVEWVLPRETDDRRLREVVRKRATEMAEELDAIAKRVANRIR